jgi:hypothetical protein
LAVYSYLGRPLGIGIAGAEFKAKLQKAFEANTKALAESKAELQAELQAEAIVAGEESKPVSKVKPKVAKAYQLSAIEKQKNETREANKRRDLVKKARERY